jgi:hypothetical protein
MLMTSLIVSNLFLNGVLADDLNQSNLSPQVQLTDKWVKVELPLPVKAERQKFVINVTSDNGYICHNYFREQEIKDKLFSLQTIADTVPVLEKKLLDTPVPVSMISSSTTSSIAIGAVLGLITGFFISKK